MVDFQNNLSQLDLVSDFDDVKASSKHQVLDPVEEPLLRKWKKRLSGQPSQLERRTAPADGERAGLLFVRKWSSAWSPLLENAIMKFVLPSGALMCSASVNTLACF